MFDNLFGDTERMKEENQGMKRRFRFETRNDAFSLLLYLPLLRILSTSFGEKESFVWRRWVRGKKKSDWPKKEKGLTQTDNEWNVDRQRREVDTLLIISSARSCIEWERNSICVGISSFSSQTSLILRVLSSLSSHPHASIPCPSFFFFIIILFSFFSFAFSVSLVLHLRLLVLSSVKIFPSFSFFPLKKFFLLLHLLWG